MILNRNLDEHTTVAIGDQRCRTSLSLTKRRYEKQYGKYYHYYYYKLKIQISQLRRQLNSKPALRTRVSTLCNALSKPKFKA